MDTQPVTAPQHPLHALTTYELQRYRRELDHALKSLPTSAPVRAQLQDKLAEVKAEQESRLRIREVHWMDRARHGHRASGRLDVRAHRRHPAEIALPDNLTSIVFRALYSELDLHLIGATYVVVPKGTLILVGESLRQICRALAENGRTDSELADMLAVEPLPRRIK
jgi:hypothetical protein